MSTFFVGRCPTTYQRGEYPLWNLQDGATIREANSPAVAHRPLDTRDGRMEQKLQSRLNFLEKELFMFEFIFGKKKFASLLKRASEEEKEYLNIMYSFAQGQISSDEFIQALKEKKACLSIF
jgi:hypothetical protein